MEGLKTYVYEIRGWTGLNTMPNIADKQATGWVAVLRWKVESRLDDWSLCRRMQAEFGDQRNLATMQVDILKLFGYLGIGYP